MLLREATTSALAVQGGCCACSDAYHFAMQLHSVSSACSENYDLSMQLHKCANQTACSSVFQAASCSLRAGLCSERNLTPFVSGFSGVGRRGETIQLTLVSLVASERNNNIK